MYALTNLPIEIIREHIIPFTYNCQSQNLCNEIKLFYKLRKQIFEMFANRHLKNISDDNEFMRHINYQYIFYQYLGQCLYNTFHMNQYVQTRYINSFYKKEFTSQIIFMLNSMSLQMKQDFCNLLKKSNPV
jgi:hypothetical protein